MTDVREVLPTSFNRATVFSAVVGKQSDSDAVQFDKKMGLMSLLEEKLLIWMEYFKKHLTRLQCLIWETIPLLLPSLLDAPLKLKKRMALYQFFLLLLLQVSKA